MAIISGFSDSFGKRPSRVRELMKVSEVFFHTEIGWISDVSKAEASFLNNTFSYQKYTPNVPCNSIFSYMFGFRSKIGYTAGSIVLRFTYDQTVGIFTLNYH